MTAKAQAVQPVGHVWYDHVGKIWYLMTPDGAVPATTAQVIDARRAGKVKVPV